jgi:hypothetical protein
VPLNHVSHPSRVDGVTLKNARADCELFRNCILIRVWLMPPSLGTNSISTGATSSTFIAPWLAPLGIRIASAISSSSAVLRVATTSLLIGVVWTSSSVSHRKSSHGRHHPTRTREHSQDLLLVDLVDVLDVDSEVGAAWDVVRFVGIDLTPLPCRQRRLPSLGVRRPFKFKRDLGGTHKRVSTVVHRRVSGMVSLSLEHDPTVLDAVIDSIIPISVTVASSRGPCSM